SAASPLLAFTAHAVDSGDSGRLLDAPVRRCLTTRKWRTVGLPAECSPYRLDDSILGRLVEIGMHRQADHFLGQPLAHRQPAIGLWICAIGRLSVHRLRVVDG